MGSQKFDEQSIRRIVKSVLWSERTMRNQIKWPRYYSRRGIGGGAGTGMIAVKIENAIGVAEFVYGTDEFGTNEDIVLAPGTGVLLEKVDNNRWRVVAGSDNVWSFYNGLPDPVTAPGSGEFKVGYVDSVLDTEILVQVSCNTFDTGTGT